MQRPMKFYVPCCECGFQLEVARATAERYARGDSCVVCKPCEHREPVGSHEGLAPRGARPSAADH